METKNLRKKWPKFIRWLDKQDYGQELKDAYRINILRVLLEISGGTFLSYDKYYSDYANAQVRSEESLNRTRFVLDMIKKFDILGLYPDQEAKKDKRNNRSKPIEKNSKAVKRVKKTTKKRVNNKEQATDKSKTNKQACSRTTQKRDGLKATELSSKWQTFINHLDEQGYSEARKKAYLSEINRIIAAQKDGSFVSYEEYLSNYERIKPRTENAMWYKRHIVGMIKRYDLYNYLPDKGIRIFKERDRTYEVLHPSYKALVDTYRIKLSDKGLRDTTISSDVTIATLFLKHLQDSGIEELRFVKEDIIHQLFYKDGSILRGYDFSFGVRRFMNVMKSAIGEGLCSHICSFLPKSAKVHKPYDAITKDELDKLKAVLLDDNLGFPLRDRAILIIAIYTGLRRSDIANLRLNNIDWEGDRIKIVQGKTGNPVALPLRPVVGNAIYDYITKERPQSDSPYIFLHSQKGTKLSSTFFSKMSYKFFDAAGIRKNGENRGMHMFRHYVATSLINEGHDTPIVMSVLGHTVPLAVDYYLESDYMQLKECGIDISRWPIRKEVLL